MAEPQQLDEAGILNIVGQELSYASGGNENDFIEAQRQEALAYYLGQKRGDEVEGRSEIVSTDVADAIEWIMPEIMKAFTQNNEVVTYDPCYPGDEAQAEMESRYVYDILMKDNNGFLVLHEFIKDALMQKNGFVKIIYVDDVEVTTEQYTGLTEIEYNMVLADPELEITELTVDETGEIPIYDVKVDRTRNRSKIEVCAVPPEEFRAAKMHNSIDLQCARFTAHTVLKTRSELVEEGYDKEFVWSLPSSHVYENDREYRFYMQGETVQPSRDMTNDESNSTIEIAECYMRIDLEGDGIARLHKITAAGGDNPTHILDIEEIDYIPFVSTTAILMSHKLYGLSIHDRLKQIQDLKTTLWRNILDNIYLQNNQRTIVLENQVNLDDLLISRPGGIIRAKRPDAVQPYQTPPLSPDAYKMMDYADQVRAGRTGVSPEGAVTDNMIGDRVGSEGVDRMLNQKEELVGLMIRVIAETGIKPICNMIRDLVIKHQDVAKPYKDRGKWVQVNPSMWRERVHSTIRVGTGTGNRQEQQATLQMILQFQTEQLQNPNQTLVMPEMQFRTVNDLAKAGGLPGAEGYLLDPASPQGQQYAQQIGQQNQQMQQMEEQKEQAMLQAQQALAQAETTKAQAALESVRLKAQIEQLKARLDQAELLSDTEVAMLKQQLDEAEVLISKMDSNEEMKFKYWDRKEFYNLEREKIDAQKQIAKDKPKPTGNNDG